MKHLAKLGATKTSDHLGMGQEQIGQASQLFCFCYPATIQLGRNEYQDPYPCIIYTASGEGRDLQSLHSQQKVVTGLASRDATFLGYGWLWVPQYSWMVYVMENPIKMANFGYPNLGHLHVVKLINVTSLSRLDSLIGSQCPPEHT